MLAVIQSKMPGNYRLNLPCAVLELGMIERHVPEKWLTRLGTEEVPTSVARVLSHLPDASFAHFACFRSHDIKNPLNSAFLLSDGDLLNNLASALSTRFEQKGQLPDLEESVALYRQALVLLPAAHPDPSASLNKLASALSTQFEQKGQLADLEDSVAFYQEAFCKATSKMRAYQATQRLGRSCNTKTKEYND